MFSTPKSKIFTMLIAIICENWVSINLTQSEDSTYCTNADASDVEFIIAYGSLYNLMRYTYVNVQNRQVSIFLHSTLSNKKFN